MNALVLGGFAAVLVIGGCWCEFWFLVLRVGGFVFCGGVTYTDWCCGMGFWVMWVSGLTAWRCVVLYGGFWCVLMWICVCLWFRIYCGVGII